MEKCSISFMWFRFGHLDAPMMSKKCVCVWGGLQFRLSSPRTHWHQDPHTTLNVLNQLLCTLQTDRFGWVCLPLNYLRWNYILKGFYFVDLTVFFSFCNYLFQTTREGVVEGEHNIFIFCAHMERKTSL